jgi:hypothetical protein
MGITTPGNKTVFRRGRIGKTSGTLSFRVSSSSSSEIIGINSESSSIPPELNRLSILYSNKFFITSPFFLLTNSLIVYKLGNKIKDMLYRSRLMPKRG